MWLFGLIFNQKLIKRVISLFFASCLKLIKNIALYLEIERLNYSESLSYSYKKSDINLLCRFLLSITV